MTTSRSIGGGDPNCWLIPSNNDRVAFRATGLRSFVVGEESLPIGISRRFGPTCAGTDWSAPEVPRAPCLETLFPPRLWL